LANEGPKVLGVDPNSSQEVTLRTGRFGPYVQLGEPDPETKEKPKRSGIPKGWAVDEIDFDKAMMLLSLPRDVGPHPEDGEMIEAGLGRYGPFVKHGKTYANLESVEEVFEIGLNRAVTVIAEKKANPRGRGRAAAKPKRELGKHPETEEIVGVFDGRYGPYVKHGKTNATIPKDISPDEITLDQALTLIAEREAKAGKKKPAAKKSAKKAAKKTLATNAAKKPAAKKTTRKSPAKKTAAKKSAKASEPAAE
ncbi:MAG: topoisomerase C-terminal repeat-containing protein, partial [Pseudomonadota bacterium]